MSQLESLLVARNNCDRALARYHLIYHRRSCAQALGYTGVVGLNRLGADRAKITQFDVCCLVGDQHEWEPYFDNSVTRKRMCAALFGAMATPAQAESAEEEEVESVVSASSE
jgi:hypothetical protein